MSDEQSNTSNPAEGAGSEAAADGAAALEGADATASAEAQLNAAEAAASTKEEKKIVQELKRKLKYKVDGQEFEDELDFNDEEKMREMLQLSKVARKRMNEYSTLDKQVGAFLEKLKKDPRSVLSHPDIGMDLKKFAADIIEDEIERSKKSPEQLRAEELETELKRLKEERENEKKSAREREIEALEEKEFERYNTLIEKAVASTELPNSPYVVQKMADYLILAVQNGIEIDPLALAPIVRDEVMNDIQELFKVAPVELIEKLVGKDKLKEVRQKAIKAVKNPETASATGGSKIPDVAKGSSPVKSSEPKKNFKDFFGV